MGHQGGHFLQGHALLDGAFHAQQADAILVLHQLADRTHPAVAEVVDIVGRAVGVLEPHKFLDREENVLVDQGAGGQINFLAQTGIKLVTTHAGQVVIVGRPEQVREEVGRDLGRGRRTGTQTTINLNLRGLHVDGLVEQQRVAKRRRNVHAAGMQHVQLFDAGVTELLDQLDGHFLGGLCKHLAVLVHNILG